MSHMSSSLHPVVHTGDNGGFANSHFCQKNTRFILRINHMVMQISLVAFGFDICDATLLVYCVSIHD